MTVTDEEVRRVAEMGDELGMHVNKFAHWLSRKEEKLLWAHLAARRYIYPKIGRNEPCPGKSGRKVEALLRSRGLAVPNDDAHEKRGYARRCAYSSLTMIKASASA